MESTFGLMGKCMTDNGRKTRCTVKVCSFGEMARDMKVSSSMTNEKAEAHSSGKMAGGTRETGARASNMEWAYLPAKIIKLRGESGSMAERLGGLSRDIDHKHFRNK